MPTCIYKSPQIGFSNLWKNILFISKKNKPKWLNLENEFSFFVINLL